MLISVVKEAESEGKYFLSITIPFVFGAERYMAKISKEIHILPKKATTLFTLYEEKCTVFMRI